MSKLIEATKAKNAALARLVRAVTDYTMNYRNSAPVINAAIEYVDAVHTEITAATLESLAGDVTRNN